VFSGEDWQPPKDWTRTNGLVEDIRKSFAEIEEQLRLEEESKPRDVVVHEPSDPIALPGDVRAGSAGQGGAPLPAGRNRLQVAPQQNVAPAQPAPAPPPAAPPPATTQPLQQPRGDNGSPIRINPLARSVNVERVE
jgi:general secretion pathway protein D